MKFKKILLGLTVASAFTLVLTSCDEADPASGESEEEVVDQSLLADTTLYCVGDSTVCSFNDAYYIPRYGYGTQLDKYLDEKVTINNLAMSGRSSKSFLSEGNYTTLTNSIKAGDYLLIGFGHNDQKTEVERYTNPNLPYTDSTTTLCSQETSPVSFKYTLYNYYIKVAQEKGAYPILCTPVARANSNNNYDGSSGHITSNATAIDSTKDKYKAYGALTYAGGNYAQAIRDLGTEVNVPVIDLTTVTVNDYKEIGYNKAIDYHAWTLTSKGVRGGLDTTHTNYYGALMNAYHVATLLKDSNSDLKKYVKADITKPGEDNYQKSINTSYVEPTYDAFNSSKKSTLWTTITEPWYGTVFGDAGGATKITTANFTVSQSGSGDSATYTVGSGGNGKIASDRDSAAMVFQQIPSNKNFTFTATCTLTTFSSANQCGFGLTLRDDIYIDTYSQAITTNYICAGAYGTSTGMKACFDRTGGSLNSVDTKSFAQGDVLTLSISRINQTYVTTIMKGSETIATKTYTDYDLVAVDNDYMYVGMLAVRNTTCTYSNVSLTITGDAVAA